MRRGRFGVAAQQVQSNWDQTVITAKDFIKNKPDLGSISPKNYWSGTLAAYTAIITKDADTIYFIEEE